MMFKKTVSIVFLLIAATALTGCLDFEERVTINEDGSGKMRFKTRMVLPKDKKNEEVKLDEIGMTKGIDGVSILEITNKSNYGQTILSTTYAADKFLNLRNVYKGFPSDLSKEGGPELGGTFSEGSFYKIKKKGKNLLITRKLKKIKRKRKRSKRSKDSFQQVGGEMAKMVMGGMKIRYDLEIPTRVILSNAEEVDGKVLHWVVPISYLGESEVVLTAEIESTPEMTKALLSRK
jgi:hypothetical protein